MSTENLFMILPVLVSSEKKFIFLFKIAVNNYLKIRLEANRFPYANTHDRANVIAMNISVINIIVLGNESKYIK